MNKFEQVPSVGHQMSLAGGPMSHGGIPCLGERIRALYSEVECIMGNGDMGTPCEQTDTTENITFPQIRWRW